MASDMPQSTSSSSSFPVVPRDDVDQFDIPMSTTVSIPINALEGRHQDESVQQNENLHGSGGHDKTLKSQIRHIRSRYLAGMANSALSSAEDSTNGESDNDDDSITISFPDHHNLVAVTGETASGKSLLVARVIELLTGNKGSAASYIAPGHSTATAEIELFLTDPYLAAAEFLFERLDLDSSSLIPTVDNEINRTGTLVLSRTLQLQLQPTNDANGNSGNGANGKARLKSVCSVNGQLVTLKVLASVASPLLAVVDTPMAAAALSKASARTGILDTAVPKQILNRVAEARRHHRECRRQRERLQEELASRTLPSGGADSDSELLSHWINELDAFEVRIANFCRAACAGYSSEENIEDGNALSAIRRRLLEASWCDSEGMSSSLSSNLFTLLTDFRDALQSLDNEIMVVQNAVEALGALSSTNSAATALERARKLLLSVSSSQSTSSSSSSSNSNGAITRPTQPAGNGTPRVCQILEG
jgi:hypothetical protein